MNRTLPPADSLAHRRQQELLVGVHEHLREELDRIADAVAQVRAGSRDAGAVRASINAMALRQNLWTLGAFCAAYCRVLTTHHTIEDVGWFPALRAARPDLVTAVDRLHAEHEIVSGLLVALDDALVGLVATEPGDGEAVQRRARLDRVDAAVAELGRVLLQHLEDEEAALLGPLGEILVEG